MAAERIDRETEFAIAAAGTDALCFLHELAIGEPLPACIERATFEDINHLTDKVTRITAQKYTAAALGNAPRVVKNVRAITEDPDQERRTLRGKAARSILDAVLHNPFFMAKLKPESGDQLKVAHVAMS